MPVKANYTVQPVPATEDHAEKFNLLKDGEKITDFDSLEEAEKARIAHESQVDPTDENGDIRPDRLSRLIDHLRAKHGINFDEA